MKSTKISSLVALVIMVGFIGVLPSITSAQYYAPSVGAPINITNNNVNNNVNTNTLPTPQPQQVVIPVMYSGTAADQSRGVNVYNTYRVPKTYKTTYKANTYTGYTEYSQSHKHNHSYKRVECSTCGDYPQYRLVSKLKCGASVYVNGQNMPKPMCTLVPAITQSGAIELQWTTNGATVAFIDSGIGHVNTFSGSRMITPTKDTAYNMTVLNDAGIAGTCGAMVNVGVVDPTDPIDPVDPVDPVDPADPVDPGDGGSLFGDAFKKIAIPVGIVFLILIVLLGFIMSRVSAAKK